MSLYVDRTRAKVRARAADIMKFVDSVVLKLKSVKLTTMFTDLQSNTDLGGDWHSISRTLVRY